MKRSRPIGIAAALMAALGVVLCLGALDGTGAADTPAVQGQSKIRSQEKFEAYRMAIKKEYGIDIRDFKGKIKGGRADGRDVTKYDLTQLLMGIKVEQEHTTDRLLALEIATDHLEEFPDYYTRLEKMEQEAEREAKAKQKN